jgi:hypothetical protein
MIPIRAAIPDRYNQALTVSKRAGRGILLRRTKTARNRAVRERPGPPPLVFSSHEHLPPGARGNRGRRE